MGADWGDAVTVFDDVAIVRKIAGLNCARFNRAIRDGKLAFMGEMLGYERYIFVRRVKRVRQTHINLAEAGLKHSEKTLASLQGRDFP
jgi:hypothetical protein